MAMKKCWACGVEKDRAAGYYKKSSCCKKCSCEKFARYHREHKELRVRNKKLWYKKHPEKLRQMGRRALLKKYGLTPADYDRMAKIQDGRCASCREVPDRLVVDHDHGTGVVRELLCDFCNILAGFMENRMARVQLVQKYLRKHKNAENCEMPTLWSRVADEAQTASQMR